MGISGLHWSIEGVPLDGGAPAQDSRGTIYSLLKRGLPPTSIAMVGDDLGVEIGGALGAGLQAVAVRTGKSGACDEVATFPQTIPRLDSIAGFPAWLDTRY